MAEDPSNQPTSVPDQVFEGFLKALTDKEMPEDLIERLRTALIEKRSFTERALKAAILPEETAP